MVVSGLPEPNGNRHVIEIALMSLDLLKCAAQCTIPHMPSEKLQLRIGFHTGKTLVTVINVFISKALPTENKLPYVFASWKIIRT